MPLLLFYVHIVACMTMSYLSKYTFYLLDFVHVKAIVFWYIYYTTLYVLHLA